jgi:peptidoglycan/xylan/chitin deacetylase (PgdA/CDA1 family)
MHRYLIKIPWIIRKIYSAYIWKIPAVEKVVYLTFDDGPHPVITPWVLKELDKFDAKATFFCIGKNVSAYPEVYQQILDEGHAVGNHTEHHVNGWKVPEAYYFEDVQKAAQLIKSQLFRPPYGRIKKRVAQRIRKQLHMHIIMWDVLSADFDASFSPEQCVQNVLSNAESGSVIVFHDSEKAEINLRYALPLVLEGLKNRGFRFHKIAFGPDTRRV